MKKKNQILAILLLMSIGLVVFICDSDGVEAEAGIITSFDLQEHEVLDVDIDVDEQSVEVYVDENVDLSDLTPIIGVNENKIIEPGSGVSQDFNDTVEYEIICEKSGSTKNWTIDIFNSVGLFEDSFDNLDNWWVHSVRDAVSVEDGELIMGLGLAGSNDGQHGDTSIKDETFNNFIVKFDLQVTSETSPHSATHGLLLRLFTQEFDDLWPAVGIRFSIPDTEKEDFTKPGALQVRTNGQTADFYDIGIDFEEPGNEVRVQSIGNEITVDINSERAMEIILLDGGETLEIDCFGEKETIKNANADIPDQFYNQEGYIGFLGSIPIKGKVSNFRIIKTGE